MIFTIFTIKVKCTLKQKELENLVLKVGYKFSILSETIYYTYTYIEINKYICGKNPNSVGPYLNHALFY